MSACYSVNANVSYKDVPLFIKLGNDYIDSEIARGTKFDKEEEIDRSTIDGIWEMILVKRGLQKEGEGKYSSDFDASYGWEMLMREFFEDVAKSLNDGSVMEIWPDNYYVRLEVKNGSILEEYEKDDD